MKTCASAKATATRGRRANPFFAKASKGEAIHSRTSGTKSDSSFKLQLELFILLLLLFLLLKPFEDIEILGIYYPYTICYNWRI